LEDFLKRLELNTEISDPSKINWESVSKSYGSQSNVVEVLDKVIEKLKRRSPTSIHREIKESDLVVSNIDDLVKLTEDLQSPLGQIDKAIISANKPSSFSTSGSSSVSIYEARKDEPNSLESLIKRAEQLKANIDKWTHVYIDTQYQTGGTERRTSSIKIESSDKEASSKIDNIFKQLLESSDKWTQVKLEVSQRSSFTSSPLKFEAKRDDIESLKQLNSFINEIRLKPDQYSQINIDAILRARQSPVKITTDQEALNVTNEFVHRLKHAIELQSPYVQVPEDKTALEIIQKFTDNLRQVRSEKWSQVTSFTESNLKSDQASVKNIINDLMNIKTSVDASLATFIPQEKKDTQIIHQYIETKKTIGSDERWSQVNTSESKVQPETKKVQQYIATSKKVDGHEKWIQVNSVEPKPQPETKIIQQYIETSKKVDGHEKWIQVNSVEPKPQPETKIIQQYIETSKKVDGREKWIQVNEPKPQPVIQKIKTPSKVIIKTRKPIPQPDAKGNAKVRKTITYSYLDDYTPSTRVYTLGDSNDESGLKSIREIPSYFRRVNLGDDETAALYAKFKKPYAKTFDEYSTLINTGLKSSDYVQIHPLLNEKTKITKVDSELNNEFAGELKP
jgi:hypothetical protein